MDFEDRHVAITGGSSGIGLATAHELASLGCHVHLLARRAEPLATALGALRDRHSTRTFSVHECDVGEARQVSATFAALEQAGHTPSILINSAGISEPGYFQELELETFERSMRINYFGTLYTTKALVPKLLERCDGYIVNVSSVAGLIGVFGYTAYSGSKFAVTGFTEALRAELKPHGVGVSLLCPPDTDTPMLKHEREVVPKETKALNSGGGLLSAEQVAQALVKGVCARRAVIVPGRDARVAAVAHRFAPRLVERIMDRTVEKVQKHQKK